MKKSLSGLLLGLVVFLTSTTADAQLFTRKKQYWSVGGSISAMNYQGDIVPKKSFISMDWEFTKPTFGIEAMRRMTPRTSVRGQFVWGRIKGDDSRAEGDINNDPSGHINRDQGFKNDIRELSIQGIFDLFENRGTFLKRPDYTPYGILGLGVFYHNPRMRNTTGVNSLKDTRKKSNYTRFNDIDEQEGVSKIQPALIYGLGFRYKIARQWDMSFEIAWRLTRTDKLDGLHGYYRDPSEFDGKHGLHDKRLKGKGDYFVDDNNTGELRANKRRDSYTTIGVHLNYIITGKVKCPKFR